MRCPEELPAATVAKVLLQSELCLGVLPAVVASDPGSFSAVVDVLVGACNGKDGKKATFAAQAIQEIAQGSRLRALKAGSDVCLRW